MGNCKDCRSWDQDCNHSGKCRAAGYIETVYADAQFSTAEPAKDLGEYDFGMLLDDAEGKCGGSSAELRTGPLFGCIQFQLKNKG